MKKIHLICNAHIDPIWQWDWQEGASAVLSTFQSAVNLAKMRENEILEKAKNDADVIVRQAKEDAQLEMTKAEDERKLFLAIDALIKKAEVHM